MVARFSPEWIEALDEAARGLEGPPSAFVIQQVVVDGGTEVAWYLDLEPGAVRVRAGLADHPDIVFNQDRETAEAVAGGELSAAAALTSGRLTVRGATARLTEHRDLLARLDAAFQQVPADA
jgi:alkyl sulfatase BDS1-like metallo-beta-lactamase superfamily hydrolase